MRLLSDPSLPQGMFYYSKEEWLSPAAGLEVKREQDEPAGRPHKRRRTERPPVRHVDVLPARWGVRGEDTVKEESIMVVKEEEEKVKHMTVFKEEEEAESMLEASSVSGLLDSSGDLSYGNLSGLEGLGYMAEQKEGGLGFYVAEEEVLTDLTGFRPLDFTIKALKQRLV